MLVNLQLKAVKLNEDGEKNGSAEESEETKEKPATMEEIQEIFDKAFLEQEECLRKQHDLQLEALNKLIRDKTKKIAGLR